MAVVRRTPADLEREVFEARDALDERQVAFEEELVLRGGEEGGSSVIHFRFSEKIRRFCAYTIDLSETLINMIMASKIKPIEEVSI